MKRKYGIVALILALIMSLTACVGNKPDDKNNGNSDNKTDQTLVSDSHLYANGLHKVSVTANANRKFIENGNTDYKISVAIYDKKLDKYLLGLECDYEAFSSSPSVLERDVFRPTFLKSRGWDIIRIWSRDWWLHKVKLLNMIVKTAEKNKQQLLKHPNKSKNVATIVVGEQKLKNKAKTKPKTPITEKDKAKIFEAKQKKQSKIGEINGKPINTTNTAKKKNTNKKIINNVTKANGNKTVKTVVKNNSTQKNKTQSNASKKSK